MDAAWKVYVGDRRFDDNQISNLFLKLKYETVGRFTFDFRPIDGDESYMVVGNTLRIFWGDLHRLDGVIQRVDWDDTLYCYHVFGADIRGFLLDRVNTEPSTVSSYTSDVQTQVMYTGCDFPSNIWTGAGDKIGTYTFHYKLGIQNTIRITGATQNIWTTIVERGTVYDHVNGCLYDATKSWEVNKYAGATLRFVSGACKNNVYNINGNSANRVCIRLPGEDPSDGFPEEEIYGVSCGNIAVLGDFEDGGESYWNSYKQGAYNVSTVSATAYEGDHGWYLKLYNSGGGYQYASVDQELSYPTGSIILRFKYRLHDVSVAPYSYCRLVVGERSPSVGFKVQTLADLYTGMTNPSYPNWDTVTATVVVSLGYYFGIGLDGTMQKGGGLTRAEIDLDNVEYWVPDAGGATGTIPGCSRLGDIYEIVTATMTRIEPASLAPATLEKDNHIIQYNQTDELPDHPTVITVMGAD